MLEYVQGKAPSDCVFVHGAGGNNALWRRTLQRLTGEGRAIAVNLPGHPSGRIPCRSISEYAAAVGDFISETDLIRPVVCGHSMGGAIALNLALDRPDAVGGLILVDTGAKLGVLPEILEGLKDKPLSAIERTITPLSFFDLTLETAREGRAALSLSNPAVFLNDYQACDGFDVRGRLGEISVRALIVCGEGDRMTPPKWSLYMHDRIRSSEIAFVPGAGHMVPLEKPELCARLIQAFLSRLSL